jgi:hypothetical protein
VTNQTWAIFIQVTNLGRLFNYQVKIPYNGQMHPRQNMDSLTDYEKADLLQAMETFWGRGNTAPTH